MIKCGEAPYLECSSKGFKPLSAFYARIRWRDNKSIEELYQGYKLFPGFISGLSIKDAKGKHPINMESCKSFYSQLWDEYFKENPELQLKILEYQGFSDIFGQPGHVCQAAEIYRIYRTLKEGVVHVE